LQLDDQEGSRRKGRVGVLPRGGGALATVGKEGYVEDFDVRGDVVVYVTATFAEDGAMSGTLWKAKPDGSEPVDLFNLFNGTSHVVTDGTFAYLGLTMQGFHRVALRNGAVTELFERPVGDALAEPWHSHFAVDDRAVYVPFGHINLQGGALRRLNKETGQEPLELGKMFPPVDGSKGWPMGDLEQTATHLVWASTPDGRVLRVTKDGRCPIEEIATGRARPDYAVPAGPFVVWLETGGDRRTIVRRRIE
jgi:hypothetical protein